MEHYFEQLKPTAVSSPIHSSRNTRSSSAPQLGVHGQGLDDEVLVAAVEAPALLGLAVERGQRGSPAQGREQGEGRHPCTRPGTLDLMCWRKRTRGDGDSRPSAVAGTGLWQALKQPGCCQGLGLQGWLLALHVALRWCTWPWGAKGSERMPKTCGSRR